MKHEHLCVECRRRYKCDMGETCRLHKKGLCDKCYQKFVSGEKNTEDLPETQSSKNNKKYRDQRGRQSHERDEHRVISQNQ